MGSPGAPRAGQILRLTGEALLAGTELQIGESGYERFTEHPAGVTPEQVAEIAENMAAIDALHDEAMNRGRKEVHKLYEAKKIKPEWSNAAQFLEEVWMTPSQLDDLIASECTRFGLGRALSFQEVMERLGGFTSRLSE